MDDKLDDVKRTAAEFLRSLEYEGMDEKQLKPPHIAFLADAVFVLADRIQKIEEGQ